MARSLMLARLSRATQPRRRVAHFPSRDTLRFLHRTQKSTLFFRSKQTGTAKQQEDIEDTGKYDIIVPTEPIVWGTSHILPRDVPPCVPRPPYAEKPASEKEESRHGETYEGDGRIELGSEDEKSLRRATSLAKRVLREAEMLVKVGVTTNEIDAALHAFIVSNNAYPSPLRYSGYPKSCCTSVNNIVVHGIPDDRKLIDGDIVNVDVTVYLDGFHGDTSRTFLVGNVDSLGRDLVQYTNNALEIGISACGPGIPFKHIGAKIYEYVHSRPLSMSIAEQFTGHGIGKVFHRPPWILHHRNDEPGIMLPGHCFTIEPALMIGRKNKPCLLSDYWSWSTENGNRSAQAEHTVLITETGVDVLTRY